MILVTGGLGFIGSHVVLTLLAAGQEVVIVDNMANSSLQTLERLEYIAGMYIPFVKIDIRNTPALNKVFEQYSIDAVVHTAGFKSLEESRLKPLEYYNDNVSCIMRLLRAMQRTGVRQLVHLSSLAVYGQSSLALNELLPLDYHFDNPYVRSVQMVEDIIRDTWQTDEEWRIAMLRIANVAGAFEHGVLGEFIPPLPKNMVSLAMQVAAQQRDLIELQQNETTADYSAERSFVHVLDVCEAIHQSLHWLFAQSGCCEAFDIAGEVISMKQLLSTIEAVTQTKIPTEPASVQWHELLQMGSDSDKAEQQLKWHAKRSVTQMIEDQWRFYQNLLNH